MRLSLFSKRAAIVTLFVLWGSATVLAADITGTAKSADKQPPLKTLQMEADPVCSAKHPESVKSEAVLVNANGTLKNVFVYVKTGLEGKKYDPPTEPVVLDQDGCVYKPHVIGVQAGQPIKILNSDGILHNVHPKPKVNAEFNLAMPKFLKKKTKIFTKPEVMIPVKCDVHPWMLTYVGVVAHPFYAVTGDKGAFDLKGLPAGTYTIEAWHEVCGVQTQEITVEEGGAASLEFTFELPKRKKKG